MFITELFEERERRLVVVYPGRFQPFHQGHVAVFKLLQAKFGAQNVYISTSPNTPQDKFSRGDITANAFSKAQGKNPFTAAQKVELMHTAGVSDDRIILVNEPYNTEEIVQVMHIDVASTVLIFAVGAPDMQRLAVDQVYQEFTASGKPTQIPAGKQVGDERPLKTYPGNLQDCVTIGQGHSYVTVVPEQPVKFEFNGTMADISHGTTCRAVWNLVRDDPKTRTEFLKKLYGRATPELLHIFNQIPTDTVAPIPGAAPNKTTTKLPRTTEPAGGLDKTVKAAARKANKTLKEMGGVGVVKGGRDPRYVMATVGDQNDVTGDTLGKEMSALHLTGVKAPKTQQTKVQRNISKGIKESDDFAEILAKAKMHQVGIVQARIDGIKQMIENDPEATEAYRNRLQELEKKKLEILLGRKLD